MSIFLSPSSERNACILFDKLKSVECSESQEEEKVKIWVSKELLAVASPIFKTLFYGEFREANSEEPIYLPGKTDEDFLKFLDCLFIHPTRTDVDESNVETILRLSGEYQVEFLIKESDKYYDKLIRSKSIGDAAVLDYLPILLKYKLNRSLNTLVRYTAALNIHVLAAYISQHDLKLEGIYRSYLVVYEAKSKRTEHEKHTCFSNRYGILRCSKCNVEKSDIGSREYLECVKFHTCGSKDYAACLCGYDFEQLHLD